MRNDVVIDSVSTMPGAYMGVVGIVQSLAVGVLLENASFFQMLKTDQASSVLLLADLARPEFWLALFQATTAFQLIVVTWHVNIQNITAFKRVFRLLDSYIPFSFVFAEYFLIVSSTPETFWQWQLSIALFMAAVFLAYTHVFAVARKDFAGNEAIFQRIGAYTFWVRACLCAIGAIALMGLTVDVGSVAAKAAIAGLIDVMILVFTFVNILFFWRPIVSAPILTRD